MNKLRLGILLGILLTGWGSQQLLGETYYTTYVQAPLVEKVDIFDLLPQEATEEVAESSEFSPELLQKYEEIFSLLQAQYIDQEDLHFADMQDNALKGFVEAIGDPYTSYLDVKENTAFDEAIQGTQQFEGIGAVVMKKKDGVQIEEVLKNSPAFVAGLQSLDLILRIEGEPVQELDLFDAVQKIRGPKGSEVMLTIFRSKTEEILEIPVIRGTIDVPSVSGERLQLDETSEVLYLEVATFGEDTATKMNEVITTVGQDVVGVILDLRGNGGGILPISVDVASFFLPKNDVVTSVEYSIFPDEVLRSQGRGLLEGLPVVVLIDGLSASASEIVAGALRDQLGSALVGTTTFGKGSVQTVKNLEDGSSLKFSVGKRFTPNGDNVKEVGLAPDTEIVFDQELFLGSGVDTQLEQAKQVLAEKIAQ